MYFRAAEILEKAKLIATEASTSSNSSSLQPTTDFQIRNRYLSRIGATVNEI